MKIIVAISKGKLIASGQLLIEHDAQINRVRGNLLSIKFDTSFGDKNLI